MERNKINTWAAFGVFPRIGENKKINTLLKIVGGELPILGERRIIDYINVLHCPTAGKAHSKQGEAVPRHEIFRLFACSATTSFHLIMGNLNFEVSHIFRHLRQKIVNITNHVVVPFLKYLRHDSGGNKNLSGCQELGTDDEAVNI